MKKIPNLKVSSLDFFYSDESWPWEVMDRDRVILRSSENKIARFLEDFEGVQDWVDDETVENIRDFLIFLDCQPRSREYLEKIYLEHREKWMVPAKYRVSNSKKAWWFLVLRLNRHGPSLDEWKCAIENLETMKILEREANVKRRFERARIIDSNS